MISIILAVAHVAFAGAHGLTKTQTPRVTTQAKIAQARDEVAPPALAEDLVRAVGVDTHFIYRNTSYVSLFGAVSSELLQLGVTRIRDGSSPDPDYLARINYLAQHGITHSAEVRIDSSADDIRRRIARYGIANVDMVEPQNEYDSYRLKDPMWVERILTTQQTIWNTLHSDPSYAGVTILGPSMANPNNYPKLAGVEAIEDDVNFHDGTCDREPETPHVPDALAFKHALIRTTAPSKAIWTTETGYTDDMSFSCGLPDAVIARYDPRVIAFRWLSGERAIYFYQLADMPVDRRFGLTGLLHDDASPKPQFTAIASMLHLLSDPGPSFVAKAFSYSVEGVDSLEELTLAKRDGSYDILMWLGVRSWDERHKVPLNVEPSVANVRFPASVGRVVVYRYAPDWSLLPQNVILTDHTLRISIDDRVSFIEVRPSRSQSGNAALSGKTPASPIRVGVR